MCILAVISADQARAALVESSGCSSIFAGMNTSETTTSHEVVDTSSFSVTDPKDLLIETWGFARANDELTFLTEDKPNLKVQIIDSNTDPVTGCFPFQVTYEIWSPPNSIWYGYNLTEYNVPPGQYIFSYVPWNHCDYRTSTTVYF